jgi:hypothetical protein
MKWSEFKNFIDKELGDKDPVVQLILIDYHPDEAVKMKAHFVGVTILKNGQLCIEG